jgi:hypothetical protein
VLQAFAMVLLAAGSVSAPAVAAPSSEWPFRNEDLFPHGHLHWARCWQLEHDYYALREQIAHTGVVWRRQQLELQWEQVRDQRRETCLMGW